MELEKLMPESYRIVLVGLTKEQSQSLSDHITAIERTDSVNELRKLYGIADIFVNPTLEDNYPTTNLEAIACVTPVITFDTGGSPESAALFGCCTKTKSAEDILNAAKRMHFEKDNLSVEINDVIGHYIQLYESIY